MLKPKSRHYESEWEDLPIIEESGDDWEDLPLEDRGDESSFFERVGTAWETGKAQTSLGQLRYQQLVGDDTPELQSEIENIKASMPQELKMKRSLPERAVTAAAEMLPLQIEGLRKGAKRGLALGMGAGAITAAAGQIPPLTALPEEAITVPAAFAGMYGVGMVSGAVENIGKIEAGLAYDELLDLKDSEGNRINPTIAKSAAAGVGIINGLIEMAQIKLLLKTIPGGQKLLSGVIRDSVKKVVTDKALKNIALRYTGKYGTFIAAETAQEIAQESTNIVAGEVAKNLTNELDKTNIPAATKQEIINRILETAEQSALAFSVMGVPGTVVSGAGEAVGLRPQPEETPVPPVRPERPPIEESLGQQFRPRPRPSTAEQAAQVFEEEPSRTPAADAALLFEQQPDAIQRGYRERQRIIDRTNIAAEDEIDRNRLIREQIALGMRGQRAESIRQKERPYLPEEGEAVEAQEPGEGIARGTEEEILRREPGEVRKDLHREIPEPGRKERRRKKVAKVITPEHIEGLTKLGYDHDYIFTLQPRDADYIIETGRRPEDIDIGKRKVPVSREAEPKAKEPWEMTQGEFSAIKKPMTSKKGPGDIPTTKTPQPEGGIVEKSLPEGLDGYYDDKTDTIYISDKLSTEEQNAKIKHELEHAKQFREGTLPKSKYVPPSESINKFMEYMTDPQEVKARSSETGEAIGEVWDEVFKLREKSMRGDFEIEPLIVDRLEPTEITKFLPDKPLKGSRTVWHTKRLTGQLKASDPQPVKTKVKAVRIHLKNNGSGIEAESILQDKGLDAFSVAPYSVDVYINNNNIKILQNIKNIFERKALPSPTSPPGKADTILSHRETIKQALSEGKPVPESVLKDYPDLAKPEKAPVSPTEEIAAAPEKEAAPKPEEKPDSRITKFRELADKMQKQIDEKRSPAIGQQNITARRARIAASMGKDADYLEKRQTILQGMADAIESGTLPDSLQNITTKAQIDDFIRLSRFSPPDFHKGHLNDLKESIKGVKGLTEERNIVNSLYPTTEHRVILRSDKEIKAVERALLKGKDFTGKKYIKDDLAEGKRFVAAGIDGQEKLDQVKKDLEQYIEGPSEEILRQREIKKIETEFIGQKIPGFFPTPKAVGKRMVEMADIEEGMDVLEPSAGKGDLAEVIKEQAPDANVKVVEWLDSLRKLLDKKGFDVVGDDFLEHKGQYDRIVQNPPFEKFQDIDHVKHAYGQLKPSGRVVSIMSEAPFFRSDKKAVEFREWLESVDGESEKLDRVFKGAESFRQTGVASRIVTIDKPAPKRAGEAPDTSVKLEKQLVEGQPTAKREREPIGTAWVNEQKRPIFAIEDLKGKKNKDKVRVTLALGKKKIIPRDKVVEWPKTVEAKEEPTPEVAKKEVEITGTEKVKNAIGDILKAETGSSEIINDVTAHGIGLIRSGVKTFEQFKTKMHSQFKNIWSKLKKHIRAIWNLLNSERGSIIIREGEEKPKAKPKPEIKAESISQTKDDFVKDPKIPDESKKGIEATTDITENPSSPEGFNMPYEGRGRQVFDLLQFKIQDRLNSLRKVQETIRKQVEIPDDANAYQVEELYHGKVGRRVGDFDTELLDPLVEAIHKSKHDLEAVEEFLYARHAPEANERLQEINPKRKDNKALSGITNEKAKEIMAKYAGDKTMTGIAERVDAITKKTRNILVNDGLATPGQIRAWESIYKNYVPIKREGKGIDLPKRGRGVDVGGRESKQRLTGSAGRGAVNILTNIIAQHESSVIRAEKAKVGRALLKLAEAHPNKDLWKVDAPELKPFLKHREEGIDETTGLPTPLREVVFGKDILYKFNDNVLIVKVDGKEHTITFNEENVHAQRIAKSLKNIGADSSNAVINTLAAVNRLLAVVNTSANPEFILSNFARDIQTAGYNINDTEAKNIKLKIFKDVFKALQGIRRGIRNDYSSEWAKNYRDFARAGAQTGWTDHYKNIEAREKSLKKKLDLLKDGRWKTVRRGMKGLFDFVSNENTAVENAIRLSTYTHLKRIGLSNAKAASAAKNLTVNFNRRGDMGQALNALYLFFNANVQGSARLIYAAARSPAVRKMMYGTVAVATMLDILNRAIGGDDDDGEKKYDKIPTWIKENNLVLMRPNGDYFKIPLPWGYNTLHVLGQTIGEALDPNKKGFNALSAAGRIGSAVIGSFNPLGSESTILQIVSPTITDPFVQWAENKTFAGTPIRPEQIPFDVPKPEYQMYWQNARGMSKRVAEQLNNLTGGDEIKPGLINVSPEVFDVFIDTFTGGAGKFIDNTINLPVTLAKKDVPVHKIPFARRLYGESPDFYLRTKFYDNLSTIRYAEKSLKYYIADREKVVEIRKKYGRALRFIGKAKRARYAIRRLRKTRRHIENQKGLTKKTRENKIERIEKAVTKIMTAFNRSYGLRVIEKSTKRKRMRATR